jgi:2',3'-cyclic-nucleotide 2'-phosphodiesterase (5'-nucleotidase family)
MKKVVFLFFLVASLALYSCKSGQWVIQSATSTRIAIDSSLNKIADSTYLTYLQPYKTRLDKEMNVVIGEAAETMRGHAPESLLSNFSADVYRQVASDYMKTPVDIAIVNLGGLRTVVPAGNITVRKVFELMPFENELVVLWLKGDKLNDLCQYFAYMGGEGGSGIRMTFAGKKATDITIGGQPIDPNKTYTIATNDYLAGGNDKMLQLALYTKRENTGIKVRNMLMDYIKNETAHGRKIQSSLDGRIK